LDIRVCKYVLRCRLSSPFKPFHRKKNSSPSCLTKIPGVRRLCFRPFQDVNDGKRTRPRGDQDILSDLSMAAILRIHSIFIIRHIHHYSQRRRISSRLIVPWGGAPQIYSRRTYNCDFQAGETTYSIFIYWNCSSSLIFGLGDGLVEILELHWWNVHL